MPGSWKMAFPLGPSAGPTQPPPDACPNDQKTSIKGKLNTGLTSGRSHFFPPTKKPCWGPMAFAHQDHKMCRGFLKAGQIVSLSTSRVRFWLCNGVYASSCWNGPVNVQWTAVSHCSMLRLSFVVVRVCVCVCVCVQFHCIQVCT